MDEPQVLPFRRRSRNQARPNAGRTIKPVHVRVADLLRALRLTEADLPALRDLFATLHDLGLPPHQAAAMVRVAAGQARWPLLEQELVYLRHLGISLDDEGEAEARMLLQLAREVRRQRWSVPYFVEWAMHQMKKEGVTMPRDFTDYHDPLPGALDVRFRWEQEDGVRWPD